MHNKKTKINMQSGAAMLVAVIFFLVAALSIVVGLVSPSVREYKIARDVFQSRQSFFLAESGVEDAFYRIKNSKTIGSSTTLSLGGNTATTTITSGYNTRTISSLGDASSRQRTSRLVTNAGAGVGFNYAIQAGAGGATINGGSTLNGNIYSNGIINAISATINGSAISANSSALATDQSSGSITAPATPASTFTFGSVAASQDFAQSFQVSTTGPLNKIQLYIKQTGSPSGPTVRLVADSSGSPSTTVLPIGTGTLGTVTTSYAWVDITFTSKPTLIAGATYWIVLDGATNASKYYTLGSLTDTTYTLGTVKLGAYSGSWTASSLDTYFKIYTGGVTGYIGGATYSTGVQIGTGGVGDAWANTVAGATVDGNLYCTTGTNNSKSCNTTHGTAPAVGLPFTAANIQSWKDAATAGGTITGATKCPGGYTSGDCIVNYAGATFGPGKITRNLTVNGGGTLTLTGTVWVVGTITITGGGKVVLPSSYSSYSETMLSDSYISLGGGSSTGSGTSGSYLFFVSTSRCPYDTYCGGNNAITVTAGSTTVAVAAQDGTVGISGGITISSAVGNIISVTGGSTVNYNSGLASPSFTSGPAGGWNISTWGEI